MTLTKVTQEILNYPVGFGGQEQFWMHGVIGNSYRSDNGRH